MASANFKPAKTSNSRVFMVEGRARGDHAPTYHSFIRMTGLSQGFGDVEKIEVPDPRQYGKFIEVGSIRGATERPTASLEGRYAMDLQSDLFRLAGKNCAVDIQIHLGSCQDPSSFNKFDKAIVMENVIITQYGTDDLGALSSDDTAAINETVDISGTRIYEIVPLGFSTPGGDVITNEIIDVVIADSITCGECDDESDGASKIYAISKAAGGSGGTSPDIIYSTDKGITWYAYDIDTLTSTQDPTGIAAINEYIVVTCAAANSLSYCYKTDLKGVTPPSWTEITTGFVATYTPNAITSSGNKAYIVGNLGAIYMTEDPTSGVTAVSLGTYITDKLLAVHSSNEDVAVAVGEDGAVVFTINGTTWATATRPVGGGVHLNCVYTKSDKEWYVGTSNGKMYYTVNQGVTWAEKAFPGSGSGSVRDIVGATDSVMYMAHTTAATAGRILRSYNGGNSWVVMPENTGVIPVSDHIAALACSYDDPNMVVGVGLAGDGTDGIIVLGTI